MTPGLDEELADEYGPGVKVTEIEPGSADDPLNRGSAPPAAPPAKTEGDPAAEAGLDADGQPAATGAVEDEDELDDADLSEEDQEALARLDAYLEEERARIREEVQNEIVPKVQSGLDRQILELKQQNLELQAQQDELTKQIREQSIAQLTPEEQSKMREAWANADKAKEADSYADELVQYHDELDVYRLSLEYGDYGVTAEELLEIDADKREVYCKDKEIAWLREHPAGSPTSKANGATPAKPKAEQPRRPAPAGARAPSDTGGGAPPAPAPKEVTGKGVDAMAASLSDRDSWETASFGRRK